MWRRSSGNTRRRLRGAHHDFSQPPFPGRLQGSRVFQKIASLTHFRGDERGPSSGAAPAGTIRIDRELPKAARDWGRVIDFTALEAGDLLLFRSVNPAADSISRRIMQAQADGGLHQRHAQWTHAAVYLGDGEHICEANFKVPGQPDGVTLRSGFDYCDGEHAIRARRPKNMTPQQRLRIAIGALTNIGRSYAFGR